MLTAEEIERLTGISETQIEEWEKEILAGEYPGKPVGAVVYGRPLMFNEEMKVVGFKEPLSKIARMDLRASQLGLKRSDYLRMLVDQDLEAAGI